MAVYFRIDFSKELSLSHQNPQIQSVAIFFYSYTHLVSMALQKWCCSCLTLELRKSVQNQHVRVVHLTRAYETDSFDGHLDLQRFSTAMKI